MRSQSEGGPLLLTAFSKHCARMWLALFGRRFACTRTRGDVGRKYPNRIHGSLQGVKVRHVAATKKLLDIAREDEADEDAASSRRTILGIRQRTLAKVSTEAVPANKGLRHFRTLTQKRLQHKMQFSVWTGFGKAPPKMRRACASAGASATSKDQVARARAFLSRARSSAGAPRAARAKKKQGESEVHRPILQFRACCHCRIVCHCNIAGQSIQFIPRTVHAEGPGRFVVEP